MVSEVENRFQANLWRPSSISKTVTKPSGPDEGLLVAETSQEREYLADPAITAFGVKELANEVSTGPLSQLLPGSGVDRALLPDGAPNQDYFVKQGKVLGEILGRGHADQSVPWMQKDLEPLLEKHPVAFDRLSGVPVEDLGRVTGWHNDREAVLVIPATNATSNSFPRSELVPDLIAHHIEEVFTTSRSADGPTKVLGSRREGDSWYMFGSSIPTASPGATNRARLARIKDIATTWIIPESLLKRSGASRGQGVGPFPAINNAQRILSAPWRDYLKGPSFQGRPHVVQAVHTGPNGLTKFVGMYDAVKGVLGTAQSIARGLEQLAGFAGMLGSLGQFGDALGFLSALKIPQSPGELLTSLLLGKGILPESAPSAPVATNTGSGIDGLVVTKGGAAAALRGEEWLNQFGRTKTGKGEEPDALGGDKSGKGTATRPLTFDEEQQVKDAISRIENSEFGQTDEGKAVTEQLRKKLEDGDIEHVESGAKGQAHFDPVTGKIRLEDSNFKPQSHLDSVLVHEGTHAVDHSQFPGSGKSIANEVRAFENQARYLRTLDPKSLTPFDRNILDAYNNATSRDEFVKFVKKFPEYAGLPYNRYPTVAPPPPLPPMPERSNFPPNSSGDLKYIYAKSEYDRILALHKNYESGPSAREQKFERDRQLQFDRDRQTRKPSAPFEIAGLE